MPIEITIPSPGESVSEVVIGPWHRRSGEWVRKDEVLTEIESDKVTQEVYAPESGLLRIAVREGATMKVGDVIATIDPDAKRPPGAGEAEVAPAAASQAAVLTEPGPAPDGAARATPVARKLAADRGVDLAQLRGTGPSGRVTKADVLAAAEATPAAAPHAAVRAEEAPPAPPPAAPPPPPGARTVRRERLSLLRQRIAERLVAAQRSAAMLTTFNEADLSEVLRLRAAHKEAFQKAHGVGLGFMSFFVKACCSALREFPRVNAFIAGPDVEYHDYVDVSIAVSTERGLVVPVIRNAESMSFAAIERAVADLAARARAGKLTVDEMTGGTFTISNGGVYGSMMSTPILNPPQSGILGMHRIINRPVEDPERPGQIVLRPMMYLALSYDHRLVDGEQAVRFLVHVRHCIEKPERLLLGV